MLFATWTRVFPYPSGAVCNFVPLFLLFLKKEIERQTGDGASKRVRLLTQNCPFSLNAEGVSHSIEIT